MAETMHPDWSSDVARIAGADEATLLGGGMEGVVYSMSELRVAKVWFRRQSDELHRLGEFYAELRAQDLPFEVPEFLGVAELPSGNAVSFERELSGVQLRQAMESGVTDFEAAKKCMIDVVAALGGTSGGRASSAMAVLDENSPMRSDGDTWGVALANLMARRIKMFGDQLRFSVPDFDRKAEQITRTLRALRLPPDAIVHGDLVPLNVLVDDECRPAAVLDWGFLSTAGDPAFEASVAAGIFDMYGPEARTRDDAIIADLAARLGHSVERMLFYRAVYAIITSNAYDPAGQDGHYDWCIRALRREDVTEALFTDVDRL
jgi:aminoglycoside phosphotransferase (APT) family kinase protein